MLLGWHYSFIFASKFIFAFIDSNALRFINGFKRNENRIGFKLLLKSVKGKTVTYGSQDTRKVFGQWLELHHSRSELWPQKLSHWYEAHGGDEANGKGLTDEMMLEWMAEETGWDELKDDYFLRLYRRQKQWGRGKKEGRENLLLASAIAKSKLLTTNSSIDGDRVHSVDTILNVLRGILNPLPS